MDKEQEPLCWMTFGVLALNHLSLIVLTGEWALMTVATVKMLVLGAQV